ncbi:hypothetical protein FQA39_LY15666 [Lamprigera yunnana]|nr:hypothetical protein FQA39_LY15666 [Lamprigera yunnana]
MLSLGLDPESVISDVDDKTSSWNLAFYRKFGIKTSRLTCELASWSIATNVVMCVIMVAHDQVTGKGLSDWLFVCAGDAKVYRDPPALWNVKCKDYSNRVKKWEQGDVLIGKYREKYTNAEKQEMVKKINSLRTNFRKELKRIRAVEKSLHNVVVRLCKILYNNIDGLGAAVKILCNGPLKVQLERMTPSRHFQTRNAKTLTPSHMKQCILSESRFDFLKDLVKNVPDPSAQEDNENDANEALDFSVHNKSTEDSSKTQDKSKPDIVANFYIEQGPSAGRTPVIQYGPKVKQMDKPKLSFSIENIVSKDVLESKVPEDLSKISTSSQVPHLVPSVNNKVPVSLPSTTTSFNDNVPPLIPISRNNLYGQSSGDNNLYIDEDYDN